MKQETPNKQVKIAALTVAVLATLAPSVSYSAITGPYTTDANTLHLYNADQTSAPITDSGSAGTLYDLTTVSATPGSSSYTGFGNALSFLNASSTQAKTATNSQTAWQGASGSFTYEAMIDVTAALSGGTVTQTIMSRDHSTGGPNDRSFIFRLNGANIDFINTGAASIQTVSIALPTAGFNAFALNTWFQIAVTYNGTENTANNLSFYFTKVDPSVTTANLLGTAQLNADVGEVIGVGAGLLGNPFDVGNRDNAAGGFNGYIDQVRISDIARTADQFIFAPVPEPSSLALCGMSFLGLVAVIRRKRKI